MKHVTPHHRVHFTARFLAAAAALLLLIAPPAPAGTVPGELIVRLRQAPARSTLDQVDRTGVARLDALAAARQIEITAPFKVQSRQFSEMETIVLLRVNAEVNLDELAAALAGDPNVEWTSPNHTFQSNLDPVSVTPDDSLFASAWWLHKISAPSAWEFVNSHATVDSPVVIGVIDTGVDSQHPDLRANVWHNGAETYGAAGVDDDGNGFIDDSVGWDFVDAPSLPSSGDHLTRDADPSDELGHGTYVSGLAAATTNNGQCMAGVANNFCRIQCLRAGNAEGFLEEDDIAAALLYGAQNGARVINMSFGDVVASPLLRETVRLVGRSGVVLTASAGNANSQVIHYPSGYPEAIAVGATDEYDRRASFSNYGPSVVVMAPGFDLMSLFPGNGCGSWSYPHGTSYAAPMVAAAAALMLSVNPNLTPDDIKQIVRSTADDTRPEGWDPETVSGRLNMRRAVEQARFGSDVVARILSPRLDSGMSASFDVRGSVWGAAFDHWALKAGIGENPVTWIDIAEGNERALDALLGTVQIPAVDTAMVLRLETWGTAGQLSVDHVHLFVQHSAPRIDSLKVRRMLDYDTYGDLVQVWTNQFTGASLLLTNGTGDSVREEFGYVSREHAGLLSQIVHPGVWQARVRLENAAGMATLSDPFTFSVTEPPFRSNLWVRTPTRLSHGYIGPFSTDFNGNGRPEIWRLPIRSGGVLGNLEAVEWNGQDFTTQPLAVYGVYIPQAVGDADGDGLLEFMGRRGDTTRIWEQAEPNGFLSETVFNQPGYIGAAFFDFDSGDGHGNLILRKYTGQSAYDKPRYVVYAPGQNYELSIVDTIPNNTRGSNDLGSPKILIGDLDRDGLQDYLFGDYDGDLVFCEKSGSEIVQRWSARLPQNDATSWFASGDFDGDGAPEFVAGCRSNYFGGSESQLRSRRWEYYVFRNVTNDSFAVVDSILIQGSEDVGDHPASVNAVDVNGDGRAEILISAFPDFYVIERDQLSGRYRPRWYDSPSAANVTLAVDWNHNGLTEYFYSDGTTVQRVEAASAFGSRPAPPVTLTGEPLNASEVRLYWSAVAGADGYRIYRAVSTGVFELLALTVDTMQHLSEVPAESALLYAVTTIDHTYSNPESVYSNYLTLTASQPPSAMDTAGFVPPHFVRVRFSEPMGASAGRQWNYRLADGRQPAVVSPAEGGRVVNLAFDGLFPNGQYRLTLHDLRDVSGVLLPAADSVVVFQVTDTSIVRPYVVSHELPGMPAATSVEILFSEPMSASVLDPANYRIDAPYGVVSVNSLANDRSKVLIELDPRHPVGALGQQARLRLRNLAGESRVPMDTLDGQADLLLGGAALSVEDAYVYPNPYKGIGAAGQPGIVFAGLPKLATIRVFTMQGVPVRKIEHNNALGAARWDLTNDNGDKISGGIYLYTIESDGRTVRGKLAVLR